MDKSYFLVVEELKVAFPCINKANVFAPVNVKKTVTNPNINLVNKLKRLELFKMEKTTNINENMPHNLNLVSVFIWIHVIGLYKL